MRQFKLLKSLGAGAFGEVHLAELREDDDFVQTLAVKWLHARWSADANLVGRLKDEARLLALLNNEHIVRVHGLTRLEGRLAILMEPIDGADLSQLRDQPLPARVALEITAAAADALDAAWCTVPVGQSDPLRVVHRDIKPSNIMVTARGGVKVMDFGVARATFDAREAETQSQQFGTARYMAPERWLEGVADAPSDVFSLGVTFLEILGGTPLERARLARGAFSDDIDEALRRIDNHPAVRSLVAGMLEYEPEDRPTAAAVAKSCAELASALPKPDLREWAMAWVPVHRQAGHQTAADGTIVNEEVSTDPFADAATAASTQPTPPQLFALEEPPTQLGLGPTGRGVVIGGLLALTALAVVLTWRPPRAARPEVVEVPVFAAPDRAEPASGPPIITDEPPALDLPARSAPVEPEPPVPATRRPVARIASPPAATEPVEEPEPPAEPKPPTTLVTLRADPTLTITYDGVTITHGRAFPLPRGTPRLTVSDGTRQYHCVLDVGRAAATWRVTTTAPICTKIL